MAQKDPLAKKGVRIRNITMNDDNPVDEGMEGTIINIDSLGTIHVRWDDGRTLGVIPGVDDYELLPNEVSESKDFKLSKEAKKNPVVKKINKNFKTSLNRGKVSDIKVESEKIEGGKAEKMSIKDLAKKHNVEVSDIEKEIEVGTKIELEHTDSKEMAKEIAMDHIAEFPDYYTNKKYGVKSSEKGLEKIHENKISIKDEVRHILDTLKTAKPIHRKSLDNMVNNLINKYKNVKKDEEKFRELIQNLKDKISDKFDIGETTMAGSAGAYVGPISTIEEITSTKNTDFTSGVDGKIWADKNRDGWHWNDKPVWTGGEIVDLLAKISATWDDSNLDISKEWDKSKKTYISETKDDTIHTKKWDRCVKDVEKKNKENNTDYNPYAVCTDSIGYEGSVKKKHRKKDIEEVTTVSSVWGTNGPPVTPMFAAKKGKHGPSKKTIWKGGKFVGKVESDDSLVSENSDIVSELNKVKWVKGGKFVKIKDRCAKYNNKPWCSQGAIDNPLELSDTTFENITNISEKTGLSEEYIYNLILTEFSGNKKV